MNKYAYKGPVMKNDECIKHDWSATTTAESYRDASRNLLYLFKKHNNISLSTRITFPEKITLVN